MEYRITQSGKSEWVVFQRTLVANGLARTRMIAIVSTREAADAALRLMGGSSRAHKE